MQLPTGDFCSAHGLAIADGRVYYTTFDNATGNSGQPPGHVRSLPTDGSSCDVGAACTFYDAPPDVNLDEIAISNGFLYGALTSEQVASPGIFRKALAGGQEQINGIMDSINAKGPIAVDAKNVYFFASGGSKKILALATKSFLTAVPEDLGGLGMLSPGELTVTATQLLVPANDGKTGKSRYLMSFDPSCTANCKSTTVQTILNTVKPIVVATTTGGTFLAYKPSSEVTTQVFKCNPTCTNPKMVASFFANGEEPFALLADDTHAYVFYTTGRLVSVSLPDGTPTTHGSPFGGTKDVLRAVAIDTEAIYAVTSTGASCGAKLWRLVKP